MNRPYMFHYHPIYDTNNRCWENSIHTLVNATNIINAIKKFKKRNTGNAIYSIEAYHPTIELDYYATQALLRIEDLL